jgi:hypothetical protein
MPLEGFDDINPIGRPKAVMDLGVIERGASIGCSKDELAALSGFARSTFYKYLAEDPAVQEAIDRGAAKGQATLRRLQWKGAEEGNATMLVWLGKQLLGQRDSIAHTGGDGGPITIITGVDRGD